MTPQSSGAQINPVCRGRDFVDATIGRERLTDAAATPGAHRVARRLIRVSKINATILAGVSGEPGIQLRVGGIGCSCRADKCQDMEETARGDARPTVAQRGGRGAVPWSAAGRVVRHRWNVHGLTEPAAC